MPEKSISRIGPLDRTDREAAKLIGHSFSLIVRKVRVIYIILGSHVPAWVPHMVCILTLEHGNEKIYIRNPHS